MKFGVAGSAHGHIYEFIEDMLNLEGKFIGIYDDKSDLVDEISGKYNVPIYKTLGQLLESGVEVVGTSAINNQKIDIIEKCSSFGVHVIADKPIVLTDEHLTRLENVLNKGNIEVGLMLTVRFMDEVYSLKRQIEQGTIGELLSVEIFNPHKLIPSTRPDWHFEEKLNGGIVIDLMVHSVDLYNWLTSSEIENYTGIMQKSILMEKETFFDSAQFFITNQSGVSGYFRVDWHMPDSHWSWGDFRIYCTGTKGSIEARCTGDPLTREPVVVIYQEGKETGQLEIEKSGSSATKDFIKRILKQEHLIEHKDILSCCEACLNMNKVAKRVTIF